MNTVSIYNSFVKNNDHKRMLILNKLKNNGFHTSRNGELLIVIGGDGTFLSAIHKRMHEKPVFVGFNTGNLGFLSEFTVEEIDRFIQIILNKDYWIEKLPVFSVRLKNSKEQIEQFFVQELVVERKSTKIIHTNIHVNEHEIGCVYGDAVVVSGSLGSTAYNMSANGAICLSPNVLQVAPVAPINSRVYRSIFAPFVIDSDSVVSINPSYRKRRNFRIVCDGKEFHPITEDGQPFYFDTIEIKKSDMEIAILRSNQYSSITNIKNKFFT